MTAADQLAGQVVESMHNEIMWLRRTIAIRNHANAEQAAAIGALTAIAKSYRDTLTANGEPEHAALIQSLIDKATR